MQKLLTTTLKSRVVLSTASAALAACGHTLAGGFLSLLCINSSAFSGVPSAAQAEMSREVSTSASSAIRSVKQQAPAHARALRKPYRVPVLQQQHGAAMQHVQRVAHMQDQRQQTQQQVPQHQQQQQSNAGTCDSSNVQAQQHSVPPIWALMRHTARRRSTTVSRAPIQQQQQHHQEQQQQETTQHQAQQHLHSSNASLLTSPSLQQQQHPVQQQQQGPQQARASPHALRLHRSQRPSTFSRSPTTVGLNTTTSSQFTPERWSHGEPWSNSRLGSSSSSSGSTIVVAASTTAAAADIDTPQAALPGVLEEEIVPAAAGADSRSGGSLHNSSMQRSHIQAPQQPEQQQAWGANSSRSTSGVADWHTFRSTAPHQQHQQLPIPPELLQLPTTAGPALVDISHLINLQQEEDALEGYTSSSSSGGGGWSGSSSKRQSKLNKLQQQLRMLDSPYGYRQQLLWMTVYQPDGGDSPAAVWLSPWACDSTPEQLQCVEGLYGSVSVLLQVQQRPAVHQQQQPTAVVEGLRFAPAAAVAAVNEPSGGSSSSSGGVYDFLLLSSGDFSPLENENMFPNAMVHCGDGRQMHKARGVQDLASFVAQADLWNVTAHYENLVALAWERRDSRNSGPGWIYDKLQQRWGLGQLLNLGVDMRFVQDNLTRVLPVPQPVRMPASSAAAGSAAATSAADAGISRVGLSQAVPMLSSYAH